jgi:activator of HSP90 ATPase
MAMPTSTANWHWKNKNVTTWAKEWFKQELTAIIIEGPEGNVAVSSVNVGDGDVELGQRKSKCVLRSACNLHIDSRISVLLSG